MWSMSITDPPFECVSIALRRCRRFWRSKVHSSHISATVRHQMMPTRRQIDNAWLGATKSGYSLSCSEGTREPWMGEDPAGIIAMNTGMRTIAPPGIGTRIVYDTISISRRLPRWVSISRRPGIHLGVDNHARPRSIDSTSFMHSTIPAGKGGQIKETPPCPTDTLIPLHYNMIRRNLEVLPSRFRGKAKLVRCPSATEARERCGTGLPRGKQSHPAIDNERRISDVSYRHDQ